MVTNLRHQPRDVTTAGAMNDPGPRVVGTRIMGPHSATFDCKIRV